MNDSTNTPIPPAWSDLIAAITLLARGRVDDVSPFNCIHDQLSVMADPANFSEADIAQLNAWGFHEDTSDGTFYSFRYGSA
jgi:hypothetical protein